MLFNDAGVMMVEKPIVYGKRYEVERLLASGGMGDVFVARHLVTQQQVALKVLHPHITQAHNATARFLQEIQAASAIGHEGIVQIYDAGQDGEALYYAMELLEGCPLGEWQTHVASSIAELLVLVRNVLEPLAEAHRQNIVHRDIKPDNIFVIPQPNEEFPKVKLLDFGIAHIPQDTRLTRAGLTLGTPLYMSPEQARCTRDIEPSMDVWSVGVILYEILTGRVPFDGQTAAAVCTLAVTQPHTPILQFEPDIPQALVNLVDRCLAKSPEKRPQNAGELLMALDKVLAHTVGPCELGLYPRHSTHPESLLRTTCAAPDRLVNIAPVLPTQTEKEPIAEHDKAPQAPSHEVNTNREAEGKNKSRPYIFAVVALILVGLGMMLGLALKPTPDVEPVPSPILNQVDRSSLEESRVNILREEKALREQEKVDKVGVESNFGLSDEDNFDFLSKDAEKEASPAPARKKLPKKRVAKPAPVVKKPTAKPSATPLKEEEDTATGLVEVEASTPSFEDKASQKESEPEKTKPAPIAHTLPTKVEPSSSPTTATNTKPVARPVKAPQAKPEPSLELRQKAQEKNDYPIIEF